MRKTFGTKALFFIVLILLAILLTLSAVAEGNGTNKKDNTNPGLGTGVRLIKNPNDDAIRGSWQGEDVKVQILGLCRSYIFLSGNPMIVNSTELTFAEDLPPEETLAYVQSAVPAKVFWGPEFKASFARCKPGTILAVVAVGSDYVEIKYPEKKNRIRE